jgi:RimJ/RimL family protein N-acetyltransferase
LLSAAQYSTIETLQTGKPIEIRALRPEDRDDFIAAVGRASSQSLYRRFFAVRRHFTEDETSFYLNVDFQNHVALVAIAEENGHSTIVAGGRYIIVQPQRAELAFTVLDEYQGQGIGGALLRHLIAIARQAGLKQLVAQVLPENSAMLKVFRRSGLKCTEKREADSICVQLELCPS